jgi:hypothetical protein
MRKHRKEEKPEEDYTWTFFGFAFVLFFIALAALWQGTENRDKNLSLRLDRLEADNTLQQKMIKELGQRR